MLLQKPALVGTKQNRLNTLKSPVFSVLQFITFIFSVYKIVQYSSLSSRVRVCLYTISSQNNLQAHLTFFMVISLTLFLGVSPSLSLYLFLSPSSFLSVPLCLYFSLTHTHLQSVMLISSLQLCLSSLTLSSLFPISLSLSLSLCISLFTSLPLFL